MSDVELSSVDRSAATGALGAGARLLHRRARQVRHHRAVRDAAPPPADLHAGAEGARVLRHRPALALSAHRHRPAAGDARGVPGAVRRRPRGPAVGEASSSYLSSSTAARGIAEVQPGGADHRDPARARELPALAAPAAAAEPHRERAEPAPGDRARARAAQGRQIPRRSPRPQALLYSEHVRYVEQLRRYHDVFAAGAGAGADLRRLPRRQRGHGAAGAALPRRRRHRAGRGERGQPHGADALAAARRARARGVGRRRGPVSRAVKAAVKALAPGGCAARALHGVRSGASCYGAPRRRTRS